MSYKTCTGCGKVYETRADWEKLLLLGMQKYEGGRFDCPTCAEQDPDVEPCAACSVGSYEVRNCSECHSTLAEPPRSA